MTKSVIEPMASIEKTCADKDIINALYIAGSISELARQLQINRRTVQRWIREGINPSKLAKEKISEFLKK